MSQERLIGTVWSALVLTNYAYGSNPWFVWPASVLVSCVF